MEHNQQATAPRLRGVMLGALARQLGRPSGIAGLLVVGPQLDKRNRGTITAAVDTLAAAAGDTVADIGFGGGAGLGLLLERVGPTGRVHGIDTSTTMRRRASVRYRRHRARLHLHTGSITDLPLDDASLDGTICVNIIYFVPEPAVAFAELARVLRPGGRLVLGIADPHAMTDTPVTAYGDFRIRPIDELAGHLAAAGLPVCDTRRVGTDDRAYHLLIATRPA